MKKKRSILLTVSTIILLLIGGLLYVYNFKAIPNMDTNEIEYAVVTDKKSNDQIRLEKEKAQVFAKELSRELPKTDNYYWDTLNQIEAEKDENLIYNITFFDSNEKDKYTYDFNLEEPRYAKLIKGKVSFWEENKFPISDFSFEELLK